eukprot:jgi/Bigna1/146544/aug1.116_g21252
MPRRRSNNRGRGDNRVSPDDDSKKEERQQLLLPSGRITVEFQAITPRLAFADQNVLEDLQLDFKELLENHHQENENLELVSTPTPLPAAVAAVAVGSSEHLIAVEGTKKHKQLLVLRNTTHPHRSMGGRGVVGGRENPH